MGIYVNLRQQRTLERLYNQHSAELDMAGTSATRLVPGCERFIVVMAYLEGSEVRSWVLDDQGDVVLEAGAEEK